MLITVDEARAMKSTLAQVKELGEEFRAYKSIVNAFSVWFFILTTIRSLVVSTVIVSMFNQEPDLMVAWGKGEGIGFFLLYLVISCLPLVGGLVNIVAPIAVIVAAFATGSGITGNFAPFVLPIAITYVVTFGLIFLSNYLINSLVESNCPAIYKEIEFLSGADEVSKMFYASSVRVRNAAFDADEKKKKEESADGEVKVVDEIEEYDDEDDDGYDDLI